MTVMADNDSDGAKGTTQKNLRLREPYAEALEKMSEQLYGNKRSQARVVEDLIDLTEFQPVHREAADLIQTQPHSGTVLSEEAEEVAVEKDSEDSPVHKKKEFDSKESGTQDGKSLQERLKTMKGSHNLDKGEIVEQVAEEMLPPAFSKGMLAEVLQNEAGYGGSGAYNVIKEADFYEFPLDQKSLNRWARAKARQTEAEFETFAEFAGIDPDKIPYGKLFSEREAVERAVTEVFVEIETDGHSARRDAALEKIREEAGKFL